MIPKSGHWKNLTEYGSLATLQTKSERENRVSGLLRSMCELANAVMQGYWIPTYGQLTLGYHATSLALPSGSSMKMCSRLAVANEITGLALAEPGRGPTVSPAMGAVSTVLRRQGTYGQSGGIRVGLKCESLTLWQICLWRSVKPQKFSPLVKHHRTNGEVWDPVEHQKAATVQDGSTLFEL